MVHPPLLPVYSFSLGPLYTTPPRHHQWCTRDEPESNEIRMIPSICLVFYLILNYGVTPCHPNGVTQPPLIPRIYPRHVLLINTQKGEPDPHSFGSGSVEHQTSEHLWLHLSSHAMSSQLYEADALSLLNQLEQKYEAMHVLERARLKHFKTNFSKPRHGLWNDLYKL
jgi:hypothetical protein